MYIYQIWTIFISDWGKGWIWVLSHVTGQGCISNRWEFPMDVSLQPLTFQIMPDVWHKRKSLIDESVIHCMMSSCIFFSGISVRNYCFLAARFHGIFAGITLLPLSHYLFTCVFV